MKEKKIYTKTGDKGTTSLWSGKRVSKSHPRLHTYGTIDELNSHLGRVQSGLQSLEDVDFLKTSLLQQQNLLFLIGSYVSCDDIKLVKHLPPFDEEFVVALEKAIDTMEKDLKPLTNFILPNGHLVATELHIARCICRRAERLLVECKEDIIENVILEKYINRLSDYLFVAARWVNHKQKIDDIIWSI